MDFIKWLHKADNWLINFFHDPETNPLDLPMNQETPFIAPVTPTPAPTLEQFCTAIRDYEGAPGDRNYRNNNPGNCRYSSVGYLPKYGLVEKDKDGFAVFKDYQTGWLYLVNLVKEKIRKNPSLTIYQFMSIYAPAADNNSPTLYAGFIAKRLGVTTTFLMRNLV